MRRQALLLSTCLCLPLLACGDDRGSAASDSDVGTSPTTPLPTTVTPTTEVTPTTGATPTTTGVTEGLSATSLGATDTDTDTGPMPKFDLGGQPDLGVGCGGGRGDMPEFSYIWIANSGEGTISKIDTQTLEERGRFVVRPDAAGSPSRTSVNLTGDVAVANRLGGVTKVFADVANCQDTNGTPGIQTSTDAIALPWGDEECIAWHTPFDYTTQRPVAWTPGLQDPVSCQYEGQKLWTAGGQNSVADSLTVHRLDGDTGMIEATIPMPDVFHGYFGAYGGAVNQAGDFWLITYDQPSTLVRVDAETLAYEKFPVPANLCPYGIAVDNKGRPWIGSFCQASARYTPGSATWDQFPVVGYGLQQDADSRMWIADFSLPGTRAIDPETLQTLLTIPLPSGSVKGVSIDFYGYVWVVDMDHSAFRVDPDTQLFESYDGLVGPYSYSDMTGWGLKNVANPPG